MKKYDWKHRGVHMSSIILITHNFTTFVMIISWIVTNASKVKLKIKSHIEPLLAIAMVIRHGDIISKDHQRLICT